MKNIKNRFGKGKMGVVLFNIVCLGFGIVLLSSQNSNGLASLLIVNFIVNLGISLIDYRKKALFVVFLVTYFTFLISKIFVKLINGEDFIEEFSNTAMSKTIFLLIFSLAIVAISFHIFYKDDRNYEIKTNELNIKVVRGISIFVFLISMIPSFAAIVEKIIFVQSNSYSELYANFSSVMPSIFLKLGSFFPISYFLILGTKPNKTTTYIFTSIFLLNGILSLGYGQRNIFILYIFTVAIYFFFREKSSKNIWIGKNLLFRTIVLVPVFLTLMYTMQFRRANVEQDVNIKTSISGFFESQGGSYGVITMGIEEEEKLSHKGTYAIQGIKNSITNNVFFTKITGSVPLQPHTPEMATKAGIYGHEIAYIYNQPYYLNGGTYGTSYIIELFLDGSYIYLAIGSIILGWLLHYLFQSKKRVSTLALSIFMIRFLVFIPRDSFSSFIYNTLTITNIFIFLVVYAVERVDIISLLNKTNIPRLTKWVDKKVELKPNLVFFTNKFPYSNSETFIEPEYSYFDYNKEIIIPTSLDPNDKLRKVHGNATVTGKRNWIKTLYPFLIFYPFICIEFYQEFLRLIKEGKLSIDKVKSIYGYLFYSEILYISVLFPVYSTLSQNRKSIFYSYWGFYANKVSLKLSNFYEDSNVIVRLHGTDLYEEATVRSYLPFRKDILQQHDKVYCISEGGKKYLESKYNGLTNIEVRYLGTETIDKKLNKSASQKVELISCSNCVPVKCIDTIIKALSRIDDVEINWIHIGGGTLLNEMIELSSQLLNDKKNIQFEFLGSMTNAEVREYYANNHFDLFINVSKSEGLPFSIMEAMSVGVAIIATDVGGTREAVSKENGWLLDFDNAQQGLYEAIIEWNEMSKKRRDELAANSYKKWSLKFSSRNNFPNFIEEINGGTKID